MRSRLLAPYSLFLTQFGIQGAIANGGYAQSCTNIGLYPPDGTIHYWSIVADCLTSANPSTYNRNRQINIDSCFTNTFGTLTAQLNGNFHGSCTNIILTGTVLSATCNNGSGGTKSTTIETNNVIGNSNGGLYCFDQQGL